jgi:hypothetical protein
MDSSLVSIKDVAKRGFVRLFITLHLKTLVDFWTSGSDAGCKGNFKWCSVDRAFDKDVVDWAKGQPDLKKGDCVCIKINETRNHFLFYTAKCENKKRFICEVRNQFIQMKLRS